MICESDLFGRSVSTIGVNIMQKFSHDIIKWHACCKIYKIVTSAAWHGRFKTPPMNMFTEWILHTSGSVFKPLSPEGVVIVSLASEQETK